LRVFGDLTRNWGAFVARGIAAILFGVAGFLWPGITLAALVILFAVYALVDGVFAILAAIRGQANAPWWALVLRGLFGIAAAAVAFFWPGVTAVALVFIIAAWAIATGIVEIVTAVRLRKLVEGEWLLGLAGALSILFGILLAANPGAGAIAVLWIICAYAIVFGILLVSLGFRLRALRREYETGEHHEREHRHEPPDREQRAAD